MDTRLDIVVVAYKSEEDLAALTRDLPSMTRMPYKLHLFDNSKNDNTLTILWNTGGRSGTGEYIAFMNTDIRISPGWDERLALALEGHPEVGAALPEPIGHDWPKLADPTKDVLVLNDTTPAPTPEAMTIIARNMDGKPGLGGFGNCNAAFFTVMVRRKDWEELKGFDERFRFYGQDHDFQRRLKSRLGKATVKVKCCPVWHRCAGSVRKAMGTLDFNGEQHHCGAIGGALVAKQLVEWDLLEEKDRVAVHNEPTYCRMPILRKG